MTPEYVFDIERSRAETLGGFEHLGRRDEQEHGVRVDKAPDEPGARYAVDLRPRPGHPQRSAKSIPSGHPRRGDNDSLGFHPALETAFEDLGAGTRVPQP